MKETRLSGETDRHQAIVELAFIQARHQADRERLGKILRQIVNDAGFACLVDDSLVDRAMEELATFTNAEGALRPTTCLYRAAGYAAILRYLMTQRPKRRGDLRRSQAMLHLAAG